ncbi:MAG: PD-(D/E)XK nuclease-like domain-containing protein [Gammaproteobacteria bacterium]|nr:PD-(D/E)XK nuclease-like domain-containing protein [Gammaproteobacteria bacterium]
MRDALADMERFKDDEQYYGDTTYVTNSQLGWLSKSPQNYMHRLNNSEESSALTFGKAFHWAVLEPDKFNDQVVYFEGKVRRGKAYDEFKLAAEGKTILTKKEYENILEMSDIIRGHEEIAPMLLETDNIKYEQANVWQDPDTGIWCKGKADVVFYQGAEVPFILDVKTTKDASINNFRRSSWNYGYDRQAAYYMDGFGAKEFWFVVIEKEAPFNMGLFKAGEKFLTDGRSKYKNLLSLYSEFFIEKTRNPEDYLEKGDL